MDEIAALVRAHYPLVYVVSFEESRVERALGELAHELDKRLWCWTHTRGFVDAQAREVMPDTSDPLLALDRVLGTPEHEANLFLLKDFHPYLSVPMNVRKLRDAVHYLTSTASSVLLLSPVVAIPPELEKLVTLVDFPLPVKADFVELIDGMERLHGQRATFTADATVRDAMTSAMLGLTLMEAENVLAKALINDRRLDERDLPLIIHEKEQIIKKSGVLEFFSVKEGDRDVGGLGELKSWLQRKRIVFERLGRGMDLDAPKGVLLIGVPGCGKSLMAKVVANVWKMPLLRFDLGQLFGMYVGQSEERIRRAVATAESVAPCVLWIDEVEKGFAGVRGSDLDSGVTARVFGTFVTWLNERTKPVFVVATGNDVRSLPPELMRKGRFDEIFFVDLPDATERMEIFDVHIRKRGQDPLRADLSQVSALAEGFTGADIESAVVAAREIALLEGAGTIGTDHLVRALRETRPLSLMMCEDIATLRSWAQTRARPASASRQEVPVPVSSTVATGRRLEL